MEEEVHARFRFHPSFDDTETVSYLHTAFEEAAHPDNGVYDIERVARELEQKTPAAVAQGMCLAIKHSSYSRDRIYEYGELGGQDAHHYNVYADDWEKARSGDIKALRVCYTNSINVDPWEWDEIEWDWDWRVIDAAKMHNPFKS